MESFYKSVTGKAPVNIALIKYWGKSDERLKIPVNDSISGTLDLSEMCATTSVAISDTFKDNELWLNGKKQNLSDESNAKILLNEIKKLSTLGSKILSYNVHIVSHNNFPTAAGLASSAAGYGCLAFVLGHAYGLSDLTQLSKLARRGSGSACRSLFGGFVQWEKGTDDDSSKARQIVDHNHWKEMRIVICVVNGDQKDVSSSEGMLRTVRTSQLIKHRADFVVPDRLEKIKTAILNKDFETFANITMQDSNQFHAICLDTFPPLFYLNDTSRQIIKICSIINEHYKKNKVAYTFDAGPNACIYLLDDFVPEFIAIMKTFFIKVNPNGIIQDLEIKGKAYQVHQDNTEIETICNRLKSIGLRPFSNSVSYLIHTSIGEGPQLIEKQLDDENLRRC